MGRLVDDLLDVSRITRGKVTLRPEPLDAASAVAVAVETSRPLIDERRHELTVDLPAEPVWVSADPARLAQVLANLLNNAAKYTDKGGRIAVAVGREGGEVVFRVRDTGVGIAPEMLPCVFDLFTQVERSLDRAEGGLGVGLTLVRRLVEMHGGTVQASSAGPSRGSEFVVRLPALAAPAADRSAVKGSLNGSHESPAAAQPAPRPRRGRQPRLGQHAGTLMEESGHAVRVAYDGPAALEAEAAFDPDAVMLDIGLPHLDGYETAKRMRARPRANSLLLVALTGYGHEDNRVQAQAAGFDHHLVKPVDPDWLLQLLASHPQAVPGPCTHRLVSAG